MNFFEKIILLYFKALIYPAYRRKYSLNNGFRFNGYLIRLSGDGDVLVGNNSYISYYSYINVAKSTKVVIGHSVSIAHNVRIYTTSFDTEKFINDKKKVTVFGDVNIGNNVLIGSNVYICPGVTIGDNVVVGANSVVTKNIKSNSVAVGAPAKIVKTYDLNRVKGNIEVE